MRASKKKINSLEFKKQNSKVNSKSGICVEDDNYSVRHLINGKYSTNKFTIED